MLGHPNDEAIDFLAARGQDPVAVGSEKKWPKANFDAISAPSSYPSAHYLILAAATPNALMGDYHVALAWKTISSTQLCGAVDW